MKNVGIIISDITNRAGTERAVSNLANILCQNGYGVVILSVDTTNGDCKYYLSENIFIEHLGLDIESHNPFRKVSSYIKLIKVLPRLIEKYQLEILFGTYSLYNCLISSFSKKLITVGCEHFNYENASKVHRGLRKKFYKKLSAVVVLTERDKKNYSFLTNIYAVPNSLSFVPKRQSTCENKEMISVGRMTRQKGFDLLLESAVFMQKEIPDWHLSIYGNGKDRGLLEEKIKEKKLEEFVTLKDFVSDIENVYSNASLYLSSSRWEGMPMVLLEAQSCGLPVVSFDCPCGPSDVVEEGNTGFLVPLENVELFAKKVISLATDNTKRIAFGKAAAKESYRFSTEVVAEKWISLLKSLEKDE